MEHPLLERPNPKLEIRNPKQIQSTKSEIRNRQRPVSDFGFRISDLFRISCFGFRIWNSPHSGDKSPHSKSPFGLGRSLGTEGSHNGAGSPHLAIGDGLEFLFQLLAVVLAAIPSATFW